MHDVVKNSSNEIESSSSKDSLTFQVILSEKVENKVTAESSTSHVKISETESSTTEKSEKQSEQVDNIEPRSDKNEFFFETTPSPSEDANTENQQPDLIFIDAVDNDDVKIDESFNEI